LHRDDRFYEKLATQMLLLQIWWDIDPIKKLTNLKSELWMIAWFTMEWSTSKPLYFL
jgi:hypothetical protein